MRSHCNLIFLTGARPGMVVGMERGELKNLDAPQPSSATSIFATSRRSIRAQSRRVRLWDLPGARMKKGSVSFARSRRSRSR